MGLRVHESSTIYITSLVAFTKSFSYQIADNLTDSQQDNSQVYIANNLSLTLGWTVQTMFSTLKESQWGDPVNPPEYGLLSTFKEKFPVDEGASKLGQKIWNDVCLDLSIGRPTLVTP